jgi:hypothetical protein
VQTIQGNAESRITSLVWGRSGSGAAGRLLSSSVDGSVTEWDLFHLQQKVVLLARLHYISIYCEVRFCDMEFSMYVLSSNWVVRCCLEPIGCTDCSMQGMLPRFQI